MSYQAHSARPVVIRARRDTLALVAGAVATTFVLSYAVHAHRPTISATRAQQEWTGGLADVPAEPVLVRQDESMTSASLVIPKSELALPPMPVVRPLIRIHGCEGSACVAKATQRKSALEEQVAILESDRPLPTDLIPPRVKASPAVTKPNFVSRVNPLNHLPDMTMIRRPFTFAGETVGGWFRRF